MKNRTNYGGEFYLVISNQLCASPSVTSPGVLEIRVLSTYSIDALLLISADIIATILRIRVLLIL